MAFFTDALLKIVFQTLLSKFLIGRMAAPNRPPEREVVGYSFVDSLPLPGDIGVRDGKSIDQLITNVKGVNYYIDYIAFGERSLLNDKEVVKPGLRSFIGTGLACPNGAEMNVYRDTTPQGDILGKRIKDGLQSAGLPAPAGVAPGILEDARDALNPFPLFSAAMSTGFPDCELITKEVGDLYGNTQPREQNPEIPTTWIEGPLEPGWPPRQTKWVQKLDKRKNPIWLSEGDSMMRPKTHNFDGTTKISLPTMTKEGFVATAYTTTRNQDSARNTGSKLIAAGLLIALAAAFTQL